MAKSKSKKKQGLTFEKVTGAGPIQRSGPAPSLHLRALEPVPDKASSDPEAWADEHLRTLVPLAAKEKEWQLKFGSDDQRDRVASELLNMRGLGAKRQEGAAVPPAIVLIGNVTLGATPAPRTVDAREPAKELAKGDDVTMADPK